MLYHCPYCGWQGSEPCPNEYPDTDEGMEQWAPVTQIVARRRKGMRFARWGVWLGVLGALVALVMFFGPVTVEAWREMSSGSYEPEDAYWRARAMVRSLASLSMSTTTSWLMGVRRMSKRCNIEITPSCRRTASMPAR